MLAKTKNYRPSDKEPFMNERQREYFRAKLLSWREDILKEAKETLQHLQEENQNHPDLADRASSRLVQPKRYAASGFCLISSTSIEIFTSSPTTRPPASSAGL